MRSKRELVNMHRQAMPDTRLRGKSAYVVYIARLIMATLKLSRHYSLLKWKLPKWGPSEH